MSLNSQNNALAGALTRMLSQYRDVPYREGVMDCVILASAAVRLGTSKVLAEERWETPAAARRIVRDLGGLEKAMRGKFAGIGWHEIAPARALAGDIGFIRLADPAAVPAVYDAMALAVILPGPSQWAFMPGERGLVPVTLAAAFAAFAPMPRGEAG